MSSRVGGEEEALLTGLEGEPAEEESRSSEDSTVTADQGQTDHTLALSDRHPMFPCSLLSDEPDLSRHLFRKVKGEELGAEDAEQ